MVIVVAIESIQNDTAITEVEEQGNTETAEPRHFEIELNENLGLSDKPSSPLTLEEQIRSYIRGKPVHGNLTSIDLNMEKRTVTIWYMENEDPTNYRGRNADVYLWLYSFSAYPKYQTLFQNYTMNEVTIKITEPAYTDFGEPYERIIISTTMGHDTASKVNWDNIGTVVMNDWSALFRIMDKYHIDPKLAGG